MNKSIYMIIVVGTILFIEQVEAQIDSSLLRHVEQDTVIRSLNMEAIYNRSFLKLGKQPISIGGYMEVNWQHLASDGISERHQFQFRRVTLFFSSTISQRMRFMSEIEFEDGAREIAVEFAALDVTFNSLFNLRGGIILNPIGAFNQNHDGPKWEFVDRPIAATQLLPGTWSNAGFGLYGKHYKQQWMFGYELYLSGGFDNSIIANEENKTFLPASKNNPDRFEENASGEPLITGKIALRNTDIGEIGFSYMGGVYNKFQDDGVVLDDKRRCDVIAIDFNTQLPNMKTTLIGEWVWIYVDVPKTYSQQFGNKQFGGFVDIIQPIINGEMLGWSNAVLNIAFRGEYVDWNAGRFNETGGLIADDAWSIMPALSFRTTSETVIRLNYRYQKQRDLLGNKPITTGGFLFGISTYF